MKQYNEKPSKYSNIGQDIKGAQRHSFDTYETTEERNIKIRDKKIKIDQKNLKLEASRLLNEDNFKEVINNYEFKRFCLSIEYTGPQDSYSTDNLNRVRVHIKLLRSSIPSTDYNKLARKCKRLINLLWKNKYYLTWKTAQNYFNKKSKNKFIEYNGIKRPWEQTKKFSNNTIKKLSKLTKGVQFGNSLTESEREYCMDNLLESLNILNKYLNFDFKTIAFSYGARGHAGSIAHYQNSEKVLAFNRGWDGALIHELGHAIDYSLNLVSNKIPHEYTKTYIRQLVDAKIDAHKISYYMKRVEIFARLFEQYILKHCPEVTSFMQVTFNKDVMPKLTTEMETLIEDVLKGVLK